MALSLEDQFQLALQSIGEGDLDQLSTMLMDPRSVTIDEQRTIAEKLGIKGGLAKFFVNTIADPTVWVAFLLSRRYPTASVLTGAIPQRYVAANNDFSGLSMFTRPVEGYFRGTNIPKLVSLSMRRHAEVMKAGNSMFELFINRPRWAEEMPIVSLLLEGQSPAAATPELRKLAGDVRLKMDELWGFLRQTKRITGGLDGQDITKAAWAELPPNRSGRYLRDYLPHIPNIYSNSSVMHVSGREALQKIGAHRLVSALRQNGATPEAVWTVNAQQQLESNFTHWQDFLNRGGHQLMSPRLFDRKRFNVPIQSQLGQELFVTDLNVVLQQYVQSVARTFANNAPLSDFERRIAGTLIEDEFGVVKRIHPTGDPITVQLINEGIDNLKGTVQKFRVPGTPYSREVLMPNTGNVHMTRALKHLVRAVNGDMLEDEILWGNLYSSVRAKFDSTAGRLLGRKEQNQIDAALKAVERTRSYRKHSNGIASYFYSTTLGLNPWSAMQNLLQPALTTAPELGIGSTLAGYKVLAKRIPEYARAVATRHRALRANQNIGYTRRLNTAMEHAFAEVFPELERAGMKIDPRLFEISEEAILGAGLGRKFRDYDAYMKAILQPFTHAEGANQIVSFFGAKESLRKAMRTGEWRPPASPRTGQAMVGLELEEAMNFEAANVVNATQFRPGPGSRTVLAANLPAPIRQFSTFVSRMANYFADSTVRGALTAKDLETGSIFEKLTGGRNLGPILRTFTIGKLLTNGARETLGVDLGGALGVTGPFTNIAPGLGVVPIPIPPLPQVIAGVVSYAGSRDIKDLQPMELPGGTKIPIPKTLFPGGTAVSRFFRAINQWRPDLGGFVDEDERLMWRGNQTDFILAALGIPLEKQRRVRHRMERLYANRAKIRDYRRRASTALLNSDLETFDSLKQSWAKDFPDMPPLQVAQKDLIRYRANARIPAVARMLNSIGQNAKYLESDLYEHDPDLIAPATPLDQLLGVQ